MRCMNKVLLWFFGTNLGTRIEVQVLTSLVTSSLSLPARNLVFMPKEKALEEFAMLTAKHLPNGRPEQRERLYRKSLSLGRWLRRLLSNRSDQSVTELIILLYHNIGILMAGQRPEQVRVTCCFFSRHYPSSTCAIASLMDCGIIEGLCGRGQLIFSERITEGQPCCICHLKTSVTE